MNIRQGVCAIIFTGLTLQATDSSAFSTPKVLELRAAEHEVRIEKSVVLTMRDGTRLSTDLYFPISSDTRFPVILMRTPYNKNSLNQVNSIAFILRWMTGTPDYMFNLDDRSLKLTRGNSD